MHAECELAGACLRIHQPSMHQVDVEEVENADDISELPKTK
jgi:hypothetical protein